MMLPTASAMSTAETSNSMMVKPASVAEGEGARSCITHTGAGGVPFAPRRRRSNRARPIPVAAACEELRVQARAEPRPFGEQRVPVLDAHIRLDELIVEGAHV